MKALDLFCCGGGASMGLHQAGFEVTGVDIKFHPRYPFKMVVADALNSGLDLSEFDLIWASPPCQKFSRSTPTDRRSGHPDLIQPVREMLAGSGKLTIIENVPGAPVRPDVILTGDMFGLRTYRERHFELNFPCLVNPPGRKFGPKTRPGSVCVAGGGGLRKGGRVDDWRDAMGCPWMNRYELAQAIPPAYARYLGEWALRYLSSGAAGGFSRQALMGGPAIAGGTVHA